MENKATRLLKFIEYLQMSKYKFAKTIGASKALISKLTIGPDVDFRVDILEKMLVNYPDLNITWLLTGAGNMLHNYVKKDDKLVNTAFANNKEKDILAISSLDFEKEGKFPIAADNERELALKAINKIKRKALKELANENNELHRYLHTLIEFTDLTSDLEDEIARYIYDIYNEEDVPMDIRMGIADIPTPTEYKNELVKQLELLYPYKAEVENLNKVVSEFIKNVKQTVSILRKPLP